MRQSIYKSCDMPKMYIHGKVKVNQSQKLNFIG
nr:MAG TPA: hypothetical protein [Caudoviricetes sp.]